ncbi:hypothetical protein ZWY2020_009452 [Hordeum vulgare]|nr:hypothetical protein ZWY2020_009452 [Hordeum vulgare]
MMGSVDAGATRSRRTRAWRPPYGNRERREDGLQSADAGRGDESTKVSNQADDGGRFGSPKSENIKNRPSEDAKNTHHKVEATTSAAKGGMKPVEEDPSKLPEPEPPQLGSNGAEAEEDPRSTNPAEGGDPPVAGTVLSFYSLVLYVLANR